MTTKNTYQNHLSKELILRYINNKCSDSEMHQVERHLLHCEFCQEALEGFEAYSQKRDIEKDLLIIENKLRERAEKRGNQKYGFLRIAAIAIALIISAYFINIYVFNTEKSIQLTENKEPKKEDKDLRNKKDKSKQQKEDKIEGEKIVEKTPNTSLNKKTTEIPKVQIIIEDEEVKDNIADEIVLQSDSDVEETLSDEENFLVENEFSAPAEDQNEMQSISSEELQKARIEPAFTSAKRSQAEGEATHKGEKAKEKISGNIMDEKTMEGLPFAIIENTSQDTTTISDVDGNFTIDAAEGDEIVVSSMAYESKVIEVNEEKEMSVTLSSAPQLEEVLIISTKDQKASPMMDESAYKEYINENLAYPQPAIENSISGKVVLEFVIDENGHPKDFKVNRSLGYGCDEEAIRLIKEGPIWSAAIKNGEVVEEKVKYKVEFKLED